MESRAIYKNTRSVSDWSDKVSSLKLYAGNTVTSDLWDSISEAAGKDVRGMIHNWISCTGYPILIVDESNDSMTVRQERFLAGRKATSEEDQTIWHVFKH